MRPAYNISEKFRFRPTCPIEDGKDPTTMRVKTQVAALVALGALTIPCAAQNVGSPLPAFKAEGLSQTEARRFDEFAGRTVLLEFFAYW